MTLPANIFKKFFLQVTLLMLTLLAAHGAGVADDYLVDVWTSENGLADSSVTAIAQTPDGYLWIGTYNGVSRFDGVRFVTFDPANTPALAHARVRKLFVGADGALWINTYDGSLTIYRGGKFTLELHTVRLSEGELTLVSSSTNEMVFLTGRGDIFRKTLSAPPGQGWDMIPPPDRNAGVGAMSCEDNKGMIWYRDGDRHLWQLRGDHFESAPDDAGLAGQTLNYITTDTRGRLWAATDRGIWVWRENKFHLMLPVEAKNSTGATFLYIGDDSRIWAVINGAVAAAQDEHWIIAPSNTPSAFGENPSRIGAQGDHHAGAWFYSYGRGLFHEKGDGQTRQLTTEDGFPGERVYCFFEDREGNWWVGLEAGGLVRIRERQFHAVMSGDKVLTKTAKCVAEDRSGTIWIGMLSGGLGCWQSGAYTNLPVTDGTGGDSFFCVCPDDDGRLWLSAEDEDLFLYENGQITRRSPMVHGVKAILRDHIGRIWVGTTSGLLRSDTGEPGDLQAVKGISRRYVRALAEDKSGAIWAGTGNGELYQIVSNTVTMFRSDDKQESGAIWSVLADDDGSVWVGTFRGGLVHWRDGKFTRYGKKEGLPDNVICQILDDEAGNLWIGSHQGVFRVAKSDLDAFSQDQIKFIPCIDYARSDGLPSIECSGGYQPSGWRDHDGRLWFTTARGATWIQPADIKPNLTPPPVVIEEVSVDGRNLDLKSRPHGAPLEIAPGKHQVEFDFTGLSLASPDRVQFRYRLSPVNGDWVLAGTHRFAQYNFLPPGDYEFRVIACNSDGVWNESGSDLRIRILPHFYETWWFQTLVVVLVLGTVAGIVRHTATRRLHQKMEELERKQMVERERARIAKDIHDDLGASLTLIAVLGDLAKKEKVGERLAKMSSTARVAVKSLDEIVWAVNPRNDTLSHLIDYTGQFATDYLRDAGVRCLLDVPEHAPAREVPANVRHNVFLVVKEALQNIVKHANASEVWLRVSTSEQGLRFLVEDNGRGFDRAPEDAWADGLRNMRQRLAEVGGEFKISSQLGKGTKILIELPLPDL